MYQRIPWTTLIVLEMMLRRLWELYVAPEIATIRDTCWMIVGLCGIVLHWIYSWRYHRAYAKHGGESNEVWDEYINRQGLPYARYHHRGWTHPTHAMPTS